MTHAALLLAAVLAHAAPAAPGAPDGPDPNVAPPPVGAGAAEALPSPRDVRAALDQGDPAEALRRLSRLLPLRGAAGKALDRYELLALKAEAHLRLKAP